jgi:hypothetical protein
MKPRDSRGRSNLLPKLLVAYLGFVLYLYLANWLQYLNLASLPFGNVPTGVLLPLVLLGVVAVTLYNSWRKRREKSDDQSVAKRL